MKKLITIVLLVLAGFSSGGNSEYNHLIHEVSLSCETPALLLTSAFTNDVITYRTNCTNTQGQCAADLALAISLMHRMDHEEACVGNNDCYRRHQSIVSNIVFCSCLDAGSWLRYAAAAEYMTGFNYGNQQDAAFSLATNMIAMIMLNPPDMCSTNYWKQMSSWMRCPNETLSTVFRTSAAVWLAEHDRMEEIIPLTNSLPDTAIMIFLDEINH